MKVAQIICTFPPYKGGMGNSVYSFAKELDTLGVDVTVFTPAYDEQTALDANFTVVRLKPWLKYQNAGFIPGLYRHLKNFDVIHLHYPFFGGAEVVWLYKFLHPKAKLIVTYHQDSIVDKGWRKYIFALYNKFFLPLVIKNANIVTCSSLDYIGHSNLSKYYFIDAKKFVELPLGIDTKFYHPQDKNLELLTELGFSTHDKIILFVGAMSTTHGFKGVDVLIKSGAKLKEVGLPAQAGNEFKMLFVGNGNLVEEYKHQIKKAGLEDVIRIKTGATNIDLRDYYNLAYVSVLPSINKSEVFGLVLVEAMACGKPVIASDLPGVRTVVVNKEGGLLVEPGNVDDLADKLRWILTNTDIAKDFGEINLLRARANYDIKKVTQQLKHQYLQILSQSSTKMSILELAREFIDRMAYRIPKLPKEAQIEVTNRCNFNCKMCQRYDLGVSFTDMSWAMYEKILDKAEGIKNLVLTSWGEPFLHPQIFDMIRGAKTRGHDVRLTTNGSLLNEACRQNIFESGLDAITFSIDDTEPDKNGFGHEVAKQLGNITKFLAEKHLGGFKIKVYFQTTYHLGGESKIFKIIELAKKLGVDRVRISRLDLRFCHDLKRPSLAEEKALVKKLLKTKHLGVGVDFLPYLAMDGILSRVYNLVYPLLHRLGPPCLRTFDNVYINQAGGVTPCCSLPKLSLGNINEASIAEIWQNQHFEHFRLHQKMVCGKCDVLSVRPYDL
jgi:glycosyltransferase involved in cell wall biosynthesis/MoaA/NifB/PqqE/SkfB family radical SAM enzyme